MDRKTALTHAEFGNATAEIDGVLTDAFVETDLWSRVYNGTINVVLGPKGSGKSAIYAQILRNAGALRRRHVIVVGAENPGDDPIFQAISQARELPVREFVGLWKLYFLTVVVSTLRDQRVKERGLAAVETRLQAEGLLAEPGSSTMVDLFQRALRYADVQLRLSSEAKADVGAVGANVGMAGTITLHEPTAATTRTDTVTVSRLWAQVGAALAKKKLQVWVLVDRLDTAFVAESEEVEAVALRALMQTYISMVSSHHPVVLKLFLRDDVWPRISADRSVRMAGTNTIEPRRIEWANDRLLDLFCRRVAHNGDLLRYFDVSRRAAFRDNIVQRDLVARLLPAAAGWRFPELLDKLRDGAGHVAPRELIRLMSEARDIQMSRLEMRNDSYLGDELFEVVTLESALLRVSEDRLFGVLCAEYPQLYQPVSRLAGTEADHALPDLARRWAMDQPTARRTADQLANLGFFDTKSHDGWYRIAPLYRPVLSTPPRSPGGPEPAVRG
jgi:hypothetical protein